jgi:hypothetical protein
VLIVQAQDLHRDPKQGYYVILRIIYSTDPERRELAGVFLDPIECLASGELSFSVSDDVCVYWRGAV